MSQLAIFYPLITGVHNPILRTISQPIHVVNADIQDFADILLTLMYEYDGIGLAAPQLGHHIRMIAVTQWKEGGKKQGKKNKKELIGECVMINPEIIEHATTTQITEEGCLSVPEISGEVERYAWIKVTYQDIHGKTIIKKLIGFNAIIVQHEIDHLNGILFVDKLLRK